MNRILTITALLTAAMYGCVSQQFDTIDSLEAGISETAAKQKLNENFREFDNLNRSGRGYYYILNKNGIIVYHPEKGLIGSDFSRFGFVRKILKERKGCIRSEAGAVSRIILFREKSGYEILCYTIPENEITGAEKCEKYRD